MNWRGCRRSEQVSADNRTRDARELDFAPVSAERWPLLKVLPEIAFAGRLRQTLRIKPRARALIATLALRWATRRPYSLRWVQPSFAQWVASGQLALIYVAANELDNRSRCG